MKGNYSRATDNVLKPWEILTDEQLNKVHALTLRVLKEVGVRVDEEEALAMLKQAGAQVSADRVVKMDAALIEKALETVPRETQMYDREGKPAFVLKDNNPIFGGGSDTISTYNRNGEHVDVDLETVRSMARLQDALPNYNFVMSMGSGIEVPDLLRDGANFVAMLQNTTKPIVFTAQSMGAMEDIVAVCTKVRGSQQALIEKPFTMLYAMPTAPLIHTVEAIRGLMLAADNGIPCIYGSAPMKGATGPISMLGSLALANAEILSGLVISQLRRPGAPYVHAMTVGPLEMRTMVNIYNGPESMEIQIASCQLARYYGLPSFATAGCSDSKVFDAQSAAEASFSLYTAVAAGASVVHDVGYLESGLCSSPEMCVLADELIDQLRFLKAGFSVVDSDTLFEEIAEVGIGGDYLFSEATADTHQQEIWYPRMFDHRNYPDWLLNSNQDMNAKVKAKADDLLANHKADVLEPALSDALEAIVMHY